MILLTAIFGGGIIGWGMARWQGRIWHPPILRMPALVVLGFLPQFLAFYMPATRTLLSDKAASICLVISQCLLLVYGWQNRNLPGMPWLMVGLACNLVVILANRGFMPLSLETAARLVSREILDTLVIDARISKSSKDILLPDAMIWFPWLADRFTLPSFFSYRVAFSLGDIGVSLGAFLLLVKGRTPPSIHISGDLS